MINEQNFEGNLENDSDSSNSVDDELMPRALCLEGMDEEDPAYQYIQQVREESKKLDQSKKMVTEKKPIQKKINDLVPQHEFLEQEGLIAKKLKQNNNEDLYKNIFQTDNPEHISQFRAVCIPNFEKLQGMIGNCRKNAEEIFVDNTEEANLQELKYMEYFIKESNFFQLLNQMNVNPTLTILTTLSYVQVQDLVDWIADWCYDFEGERLINSYQLNWIYNILACIELPILPETAGSLNEVLMFLAEQKNLLIEQNYIETQEYAAICLVILIISLVFGQRFSL